jgi:hypothetical protein
VRHAGREADRLPFAFQAHPARLRVDQRVERSTVERNAADREQHEETFEFHGRTLPPRACVAVIR